LISPEPLNDRPDPENHFQESGIVNLLSRGCQRIFCEEVDAVKMNADGKKRLLIQSILYLT
jgi:hypothetical protein